MVNVTLAFCEGCTFMMPYRTRWGWWLLGMITILRMVSSIRGIYIKKKRHRALALILPSLLPVLPLFVSSIGLAILLELVRIVL